MIKSSHDVLATQPQSITTSWEEDGRLLRLTLSRPPGNVLDLAMIEQLRSAIVLADEHASLRAILLHHEGPNFSFGASVPEHLPGRFESLIPAFHELMREVLGLDVPVLAAVGGRVLGGGLELALGAFRIFASPDSLLGQPEITLGVFAPAASILLPERVGQVAAEDLLLSGRILSSEEALAIGLLDGVSDCPADTAVGWARQHLFPKSASSLRYAMRAVREGLRRRFQNALGEVEHLYLYHLMETADAVEGIRAFLEKRPPKWSDA